MVSYPEDDPEKRAEELLKALKAYYKPKTNKLSPIEEGKRFLELLEFYTVTYIANEIGRSRAFVSTRIQLLKLIPGLQDMVIKEDLGIWEAYEISKLDPEAQSREERIKALVIKRKKEDKEE